MSKWFTLNSSKGFTLVELLVVISIIGILTGIIITGLDGAKKGSRDTKRISDIKSLQIALAQYYNDLGSYPTQLSQLSTYISPVPINDPLAVPYKYKVYRGDLGSASCPTNNPPAIYHLGAAMEVSDSANGSQYNDADATNLSVGINTPPACGGNPGANFHGKSAACVGYTDVGSDNCYDVVP